MKEYYTHGSEAYAPIPVKVPRHLPEDPKKTQVPVPEERKSLSVISVAGSVLILALFIGLLVSMVGLFEARSQRAELERQVQQLKTQQERLAARYESSIDIDSVAERAEEMGMHIPWAEQIRYLNVDLPLAVEQTAETVENGLIEDFYTMAGNMEAYFPGS